MGASDSDEEPIEVDESVRNSAKIIYGLIHERYIQTSKGMRQMLKKYQKGLFGTCPRVFCERQQLLPYGQSQVPKKSLVCFYCPRCQDVYDSYKTRHANIDGSFFGPNFAHMFVVNYPMLFIKMKQEFVGTLCGFKIHKSSTNHPSKVVFDLATGTNNVIPRPIAHFNDPKLLVKPTRVLIKDVNQGSGE